MPLRRERSPTHKLLISAAFLLASLHAQVATAAEPSSVVLLEPPHPNALAKETLTRARAELAGAGFRVIIAPRTGTDTRSSLESAIRGAGAIAAIAIESAEASSVVEVWVSDRLTGKLSIRPVDTARTGETPALLAIRAVELLRASLLELSNPRAGQPALSEPPEDVKALTAPVESDTDTHSQRSGFGIEAGAMGLIAVDGVNPAIAPMVRFSYGAPIGVGARLTWVGPGFGPGLEGSLGSAVVTQYLALGEFLYAPPLKAPVTLLAAAGLGVYHVEARGELVDANRSRSGGSTAFVATWGGGVDFRIHRNFGLAVETFVGVSAPAVTIDMGSAEVGRFGRPILGASFGALGLF